MFCYKRYFSLNIFAFIASTQIIIRRYYFSMSGKCLQTVKKFNVDFNKRKSVMNIFRFSFNLMI